MTQTYLTMALLIVGMASCVLLGVRLNKIHILQQQTNGMLVTLKAVARKEGHDAGERGEK